MCWSSLTFPSSSALVTNISPKVRGSMKRRSPPCWKVRTTWVCGSTTTLPLPRWNCPLIPKWVTKASPESRCSTTYLPRRSTLVSFRPSNREVKSFRLPCRRITRIALRELFTSAVLIRRPTTSFSRSRRITSTSGSSTGPLLCLDPVRHVVEGLARGPLLGFLLRLADPRAHRLPVQEYRRGEFLLVVRTAFLEPVLGHR